MGRMMAGFNVRSLGGTLAGGGNFDYLNQGWKPLTSGQTEDVFGPYKGPVNPNGPQAGYGASPSGWAGNVSKDGGLKGWNGYETSQPANPYLPGGNQSTGVGSLGFAPQQPPVAMDPSYASHLQMQGMATGQNQAIQNHLAGVGQPGVISAPASPALQYGGGSSVGGGNSPGAFDPSQYSWLSGPGNAGARAALANGDFSFDPAYRANFKSAWKLGVGPSDNAEAEQYNSDIFSGRGPSLAANAQAMKDWLSANPNDPGNAALAKFKGDPTGARQQASGQPVTGAGYPMSFPGPGGGNPYLDQQAQGIMGNLWDNYSRNISPQISSAAQSAGQYGSSRQGVLEANALRDMNQQGANALANLYGNAYESDANRSLQRYGIDTSAATSKYNTDASTNLGYAGLGNALNIAQLGNATQRYGIDTGAKVNMRGQDLQNQQAGAQNQLGYAGLGNAYNIAQLGADTSRYNTNAQSALGYAGLANQRDIAGGQLGLGYAGLANQRDIAGGQLGLGYAGLGNQRDIAQLGAQTQRDIAAGNLGLGYAGLGNQYAIAGMGNQTQRDIANNALGFNYYNANQNNALGWANNAVNQQNVNNQRDIANGQLGLGYFNANNNYSLGLGNQNINQQNADTSRQNVNNTYSLGLGQQGINQQNANTQQGLAASTIANNAIASGINLSGAQASQLSALSQFINSVGGLTSQQIADLTGPGSPLAGLLGGGLTAAQIQKLIGGG